MKRGWIWIGMGLSLSLVIVLLWRLDWALFKEALQTLRPIWVIGTVACIVMGIGVRALRWNVLANISLQRYPKVWQAASLGYLGNMIYPARAGELLRIVTLSRFAQVPAGAALTSAVLDRILDGLFLGLLLTLVILSGASVPGQTALFSVIGGVCIAGMLAISFILWGDRFESRLARWLAYLPVTLRERVLHWYQQGIVISLALRHPGKVLFVCLLTICAFGLDFLCHWFLLTSFGWPLPVMAAITLGVFIGAGTALPSAPGYIGIYQVACILAFYMYGIPESQAVAYSVVIQLIMFLVIGLQGGWAMTICGLRLSELTPATVHFSTKSQ